MVDTLTPLERSDRMRLIRSRDTSPELRVRRAVHRLGFRYRLHVKGLPGKPDIVFPRHKIAMFVHGCFWHRHPDPGCKLARMPKSRVQFWLMKLEGNQSRDKVQQQQLRDLGWRVLVIWECDTKKPETLNAAIRKALETR
jgi:DNA mismatch endonuclease, patch repair protein